MKSMTLNYTVAFKQGNSNYWLTENIVDLRNARESRVYSAHWRRYTWSWYSMTIDDVTRCSNVRSMCSLRVVLSVTSVGATTAGACFCDRPSAKAALPLESAEPGVPRLPEGDISLTGNFEDRLEPPSWF